MSANPSTPFNVPIRSQVWKKKLTPNEKLVLLAMFEHSKTGEWMYASLMRVARYCGLDRSTIRRMIHGRKGKSVGFIHRRILVPVAKAEEGRRRPATYRIQMEAAPDDVRVLKYFAKVEQQPIVFPEDEVAIREWITSHKDNWAATIADVTKAAPMLIQKHMSEAERLGFFRNIALKHGMPGRFCEIVFAPTSWRPEEAGPGPRLTF